MSSMRPAPQPARPKSPGTVPATRSSWRSWIPGRSAARRCSRRTRPSTGTVMSASSPEQIRHLAELIARELVAEVDAGPPGSGIFSSLDDAVAAASAAFRTLDALGLEKRHAIIESMREAMRQNARFLAALAVEETGLGRVEDKVLKNLLVTNKTPGPEELTPQATTGDHGLALVEPAPFGVIAPMTPNGAGSTRARPLHSASSGRSRRSRTPPPRSSATPSAWWPRETAWCSTRTPRPGGSLRRRSAFSTEQS